MASPRPPAPGRFPASFEVRDEFGRVVYGPERILNKAEFDKTFKDVPQSWSVHLVRRR